MELQLLEADDLYAEMFPSLAHHVDKRHPVLAAYESHLAGKNAQNEVCDTAGMQSTLIESEHDELSCVPFPFVCLTFIIKDFFTINAEEWFVY